MSHKHSGPKLRNLAILIGIAQLLLLIFVGTWLKGQYRDEENNLQKEISESVIYARQQVLDSMLVHDYINPILASKQGFKIHIDCWVHRVVNFHPLFVNFSRIRFFKRAVSAFE